GSMTLAHVGAAAVATCFPLGTSRSRPRLFLAIATGLGGLMAYVTGWGAVFAVGLVAACAVVIHTDGARHSRAAIATLVTTLALGELGVQFGVFHTMLASATTSHAIAVVEAGITCLVISLIARGQREKEQ